MQVANPKIMSGASTICMSGESVCIEWENTDAMAHYSLADFLAAMVPEPRRNRIHYHMMEKPYQSHH